ncbi:interactor of HORMAD1 protein 1-like, partial [Pyxicephalus adspersus]|uniref:interactor of HORMAD1 protein 1-like n=1 Tax=Pyxicephalus adspersus TaxID=30357 RepID=UPI003B5CC5A2
SDPGVYQKYQSKPPLCNMDGKERGPFQTFGKTNGKNIFEQFEESKRKAKEKYESEQLNHMICQVHFTVQELKMTLCHVEENTNLKCQSILDSMDAASKALQKNIASYHESMQKIVPPTCNCREVLLDLENKILLLKTIKEQLASDISFSINILGPPQFSLVPSADLHATIVCSNDVEGSQRN